MIDLVLAILHHMLAFSLFGLLAAELALVRPGLRSADLPLLGRIDAAYGGFAATLILVGIGRLVFGLKGWEYYLHNHAFWGKMAVFAAVGLLSIPPTIRIIRWRRAADAGVDAIPAAEISALRNYLKAEAAGFALILAFAAAMARGIGY